MPFLPCAWPRALVCRFHKWWLRLRRPSPDPLGVAQVRSVCAICFEGMCELPHTREGIESITYSLLDCEHSMNYVHVLFLSVGVTDHGPRPRRRGRHARLVGAVLRHDCDLGAGHCDPMKRCDRRGA